MLSAAEAREARALIHSAGLPVLPPTIAESDWLMLMSKDKKAEQGRMKFVLLQSIGAALIRADVSAAELAATLRAGTALAL